MKTVIFDLDGTLICSHEDVWLCLEQALAPFHRAIPRHIRQDNRILLKSTSEILKIVYPDASPADCEQFSKDVHRLYGEACAYENTYLYPGVLDLLQQLSRGRVRMLIVTMKSEKSARSVLEAKAIADFFAGVYSPDSFPPNRLTKSEIFQRLKEISGLEADTCISVGDQPTDVEAARSAGLAAIAITWGYGEREVLENSRPAATVSSTADLLRWINPEGAAY